MKIDAAFCWMFNAETRCDCCALPQEAVAFLEFYPDPKDEEVTFWLCEKNAARFAALDRQAAKKEGVPF